MVNPVISQRVVQLLGRGLRGDSYADIARREGLFGILPTDDDETVISKINADAALSASMAEALVGPNYPNDPNQWPTEEGTSFAVDNGDGVVTIWQIQSGVPVEQRTLATTAALASTDPDKGGAFVMLPSGRNITNKFKDIKTVADKGAVGDGVTDNTAAFAAAEADGSVMIPHGDWVTERANTPLLYGEGNLKSYAASPRVTPPMLRKNPSIANRPRQPFEDEFQAHATVGSAVLDYTAFGSGIMLEGSELYAVRTAHEHNTNHSYPSALQLYRFRKDEVPAWSKQVIYTTTTNEDIRDVNISPHPSRSGFALISFAEKLNGADYQTRLIVWNERTRVIESNRVLAGISATVFKWGNALITPTGYLMLASYDLDGTTIRIWRSTAALATGTGAVTMAEASSVTDTFASEPTLGYWQDKLVLFYRRTGAVSRVTYSFDLEGAGPWAPTVFPYGLSAHCPSVLAYSDAPVFTAFFGLGTDRTRNGAVSTTDLRRWKGVLVAPVTGNVTGGYPSIIDCGGYYASLIYSEHHDKPGDLKRTRIDRIEVDKGRVDIAPADPEYTSIIDLASVAPAGNAGLWIGTAYGANARNSSDGRNAAIGFRLGRASTVTGMAVMLAGTANVSIELYDEAGTLVATSAVVALAAPNATATVFTFSPSLALSPIQQYRAKLVANASFALYDLRHANRRPTILRSQGIDVTGFFNAAGSDTSATGLCPIALRITP